MNRNPKIPQKITDYHRNYARVLRQKQKDEKKRIFLAEIEKLRKKVSNDHLGYIAGLVDGEGTISFTYHRDPRIFQNRKITSKTVHPYLEISNNNVACLNFVEEIVGFGYVRSKKRGNSPSRWKKTWVYSIRNMKHLSILLSLITPYLIIKKKIAELTYRYCLKRLFLIHLRPPFSERCYSNTELQIAKEVVALQNKKRNK